MSKITKTERTELKSLVRQQVKVLGEELQQREREMIADVEVRLAERFAARDRLRAELKDRINRIAAEANQQASELLDQHGYSSEELMGSPTILVGAARLVFEDHDKNQLRRALLAAIATDVGDAALRLKRQEADLLRHLAIGALESDEAKGFLEAIPTVPEMVPLGRLAELESQFTGLELE